MLSIALAAALMAQTPASGGAVCDPVAGAQALWAKPETRFVIVGEIHGTAEAPAAFADLVCIAARERAVSVGLEAGASFVTKLDAYLASDGGPAARRAFLNDVFWTQPFKDGRSSQAILAMFDDLRRLKRAGRSISVFGFQPEGRRPEGFDQSYYELEMAQLLSKGAQAQPNARVLALMGNLHAGTAPIARWGGGLPAAGHLSPRDTITLLAASSGGTAWNCQSETPAGCKAHPTRGTETGAARGVVLGPQRDGAFDGLLSLGRVTASPPAVR